jgi:hypothetical protein
MTAQVSDCLTIEGNTYPLAAEPLARWLERRQNRHIRFKRLTSACWRGYVGAWEVIDDRLYLMSIRGESTAGDALGIEQLFPGASKRVFADWVTNELRCPMGRLLTYSHAGYSSIYERDLCLSFSQGVLIGQRVVKNKPTVPDNPDYGDINTPLN